MLHTFDPWQRAIETFLADLTGPSSRGGVADLDADDGASIPGELSDLPEAATRVFARLVPGAEAVVRRYPSIDRALHEVVIAEVLA